MKIFFKNYFAPVYITANQIEMVKKKKRKVEGIPGKKGRKTVRIKSVK
jgi:hypothetical protein